VSVVLSVVKLLLFVFMLVLLARVVLSLVLSVSRDWHPKGAGLVVTESVFTITDPPIKALRKLIPPLRLGAISFDLAFLILFLAVSILWQVL